MGKLLVLFDGTVFLCDLDDIAEKLESGNLNLLMFYVNCEEGKLQRMFAERFEPREYEKFVTYRFCDTDHKFYGYGHARRENLPNV